MDYAAAVNEEIKDLFAAGADVVQIDEPYMQARPEKARQYGLAGAQPRARRRHRHDRGAHLLRLRGDHPRAAERLLVPARAGAAAAAARSRSRRRSRTSTARCSQALAGKQIMVGCIDLADLTVESPETIVARIERALPYVQGRERDPRARLRHEVPAARVARSASCARWSRRRRSCASATRRPADRRALRVPSPRVELRQRARLRLRDVPAARRLRRRRAAPAAARARGARRRRARSSSRRRASARSPSASPRCSATAPSASSPARRCTCRSRRRAPPRDEARRLGADCAVAIGGGSTTGLGKAIALETGLPDRRGADDLRRQRDDDDLRPHRRRREEDRPRSRACCRAR